MKHQIIVEGITAKQAHAIESALADKSMRALAIIVGTLQPFKASARARILNFVTDRLNEQARRH
jgi:hypothetical protein